MDKSDVSRIEHIHIYCSEISDTVKRYGDDLNVFLKDKDYQAFVSMRLLNIGELAKDLSKEFKDATKDRIPWGLVTGLRNHVAHGYHRLDFSDIFETITNDIPFLSKFCEEELSHHNMIVENISQNPIAEYCKGITSNHPAPTKDDPEV